MKDRLNTRTIIFAGLVLVVIVLVIGALRSGRDDEEQAILEPTPPGLTPTPTSEPIDTPTPLPSDPEGSPKSLVKSISTIIDDVGGRVDWSHANDLIAFGMIGEDEFYDLWTMNSDASNKTCLTCDRDDVPQLHNGQPAWHPDGERIVFQAQDPDLGSVRGNLGQGGAGVNNNLWLTDRAGAEFHQLTQIEKSEAILHPHFSPDGSRLFWAEREKKFIGGEWVFKVADFSFDGDGIPRLTNETVFRPDGKRSTFYESHEFTLDGTSVLFSSDAGRENGFYDLDIWSMDIASQELKRLTDSESVWDEHAILSPSGRKIVWVSSEGYNWERRKVKTLKTDFWIMNSDGSDKQQLTHFNESGFPESISDASVIAADSSWNRDGTKLVAHIKLISGDDQILRIIMIEFNEPQ